MGIIDNKGKIFGKLNLIDLICILLVIAAIVLIAVKVTSTVSNNTCDIEYTVQIKGVRMPTVDALNSANDFIVKKAKDTRIPAGTIISVTYVPATTTVQHDNGEYEIIPQPEKYDVTITVNAKATVSAKGYFVGSYQVLCGDEIELSNGKCETSGVVKSLTELK